MKGPEWKRLVRPLVPDEGWMLDGKLLYRVPFKHVVVGILGESSSFDQGTYVYRLTLPLFVPRDSVVLTYSSRIGGPSNKIEREATAELLEAVQEGIAATGTEREALERIAVKASAYEDPNMFEAAGYAYLLLGEVEDAVAAFRAITIEEDAIAWALRIKERSQHILALIAEGGRDAAVAQLDRWSTETAQNLKLRRQ